MGGGSGSAFLVTGSGPESRCSNHATEKDVNLNTLNHVENEKEFKRKGDFTYFSENAIFRNSESLD